MAMGDERSTAEATRHREQINICRIFTTSRAADELPVHQTTSVTAIPIDLVWSEGIIDKLFVFMRAVKDPVQLASAASRLHDAKEGRGEHSHSITQILNEITPIGDDHPDVPLVWHGRERERWAVLRPMGTPGLLFMGTRVTWNEVQRTHDYNIIRGPCEGGRRSTRASVAVANAMLVPWMKADDPTDEAEVSTLAEARRDFRRKF